MMHGSIHRAPDPGSRYMGRRGLDPVALLLVVIITAALLAPLVVYRVLPEAARVSAAVEVVNLDLPPPPATPEPEPAPTPPAAIHAPPPLVPLPALAPPPIAIQPEPLPPEAASGIETAPPVPSPPAPSPPVLAGDLSTTMIHAPPPRYPRESRRLREQGTVVLRVRLDVEGRVANIDVARSSGHRRLDQAALDAVKKWRWRPAIRQGNAVEVRGSVEIPFVISGIATD